LLPFLLTYLFICLLTIATWQSVSQNVRQYDDVAIGSRKKC